MKKLNMCFGTKERNLATTMPADNDELMAQALHHWSEAPRSMQEVLQRTPVAVTAILRYKAAHPYDVQEEERVIEILKEKLVSSKVYSVEVYRACLHLYPMIDFKIELQKRMEFAFMHRFAYKGDFLEFRESHPENLICKTTEAAVYYYSLLKKEYSDYICHYPQGKYAEYLSFRQALEKMDFTPYYQRWPDGKYTEKCCFYEAVGNDDPSWYLNRYPKGEYVQDLLQLMEYAKVKQTDEYKKLSFCQYEEEKRFWAECAKKRDYETYFDRYHHGRYNRRKAESEMEVRDAFWGCFLPTFLFLIALVVLFVFLFG